MSNGNSVVHVGMDVHKETVAIAVLKPTDSRPSSCVVRRNDRNEIRQYFAGLKKQGELHCCYEAGPSGFAMHHLLAEMGIECMVVAPGLIPRRPSDRIKTDRRDAELLAINLRSAQLTAVHVPTASDEAVRDYLRMRDDLKSDLKRKKQQLLGFLLRHGRKYDGNSWTQAHRRWLRALEFCEGLLKETVEEYLLSIVEIEEKLVRVEERIAREAEQPEYIELVSKLRCLKGVDTLTALSTVVEIGDFRRFPTAEGFMKFLGLVPSEATSGSKRRQGGITKAGNSRLRKLLVESSWHYRSYTPSKRLRQRRSGQPVEVIAYADKAGRRLSRKYNRMIFSGKQKQVAVTAVARELAGFIWGVATAHVN